MDASRIIEHYLKESIEKSIIPDRPFLKGLHGAFDMSWISGLSTKEETRDDYWLTEIGAKGEQLLPNTSSSITFGLAGRFSWAEERWWDHILCYTHLGVNIENYVQISTDYFGYTYTAKTFSNNDFQTITEHSIIPTIKIWDLVKIRAQFGYIQLRLNNEVTEEYAFNNTYDEKNPPYVIDVLLSLGRLLIPINTSYKYDFYTNINSLEAETWLSSILLSFGYNHILNSSFTFDLTAEIFFSGKEVLHMFKYPDIRFGTFLPILQDPTTSEYWENSVTDFGIWIGMSYMEVNDYFGPNFQPFLGGFGFDLGIMAQRTIIFDKSGEKILGIILNKGIHIFFQYSEELYRYPPAILGVRLNYRY